MDLSKTVKMKESAMTSATGPGKRGGLKRRRVGVGSNPRGRAIRRDQGVSAEKATTISDSWDPLADLPQRHKLVSRANQECGEDPATSLVFSADTSSAVSMSLPLPHILSKSLSVSLSLPLFSDDNPTLSVSLCLPRSLSLSLSVPLDAASAAHDNGDGIEFTMGQSSTRLPLPGSLALPLLQAAPVHLPHLHSLPIQLAVPIAHTLLGLPC